MPKKHRTVVPDFSRHKPQGKSLGKLPAANQAASPPPPVAPKVKPPATSSKSGRRGS